MRPKTARTARALAALVLLACLIASTGSSTAAPIPAGSPDRTLPTVRSMQASVPERSASNPPIHSSPLVEAMLAQVEQEIIVEYTGDLSGEWPVEIGGEPYTIVSRNSYSGEPIEKAAQYLFDFYQQLGLEVSYHEFPLEDLTLKNVVAEKAGSAAPQAILLLTSHYDSNPRFGLSPGADDNASGTAAVMLAAQILSQYDFGCTLRFVNFAGEEQGLVGSKQYAREAYCAGEDIRGVINLDMIAWNSANSPSAMELHASLSAPGSVELAQQYQEVVQVYGLDLEPEIISPGISASDHASFWKYGLPAILAIEDLDDFNPYYHQSTDQLENLEDLAYFTEMVAASLATFAHMGCLVENVWGSLSGTVFDEGTYQPVPDALVSLAHPTWKVALTTTTDVSGRYYRQLPVGDYSLTVDAFGYVSSEVREVTVLPEAETSQYIGLAQSQEGRNYLPFVQDGPENLEAVCPAP